MMDKTENTQADGGQEVRAVGRGALWIAAAKGYFVLTGVLLLTLLPRFIGSNESERADMYGTFTVVMGILNPITMMMIAGTIQSVSKFISEDVTRFGVVKHQALRLQFVFGAVVTLLLLLAAPLIAYLLGDERLVVYIRMTAPIVFCYSLYAVFIGTFNGRRLFFRQALMDIMFATMKVGLILLLALIGFGVAGAIGGFLITAIIMLFVAGFLARGGERSGDITWKKLLSFQVWIMVFTLLLNLLMNVDLYLVKAFLPSFVSDGHAESLRQSLGLNDVSEVGNVLVGIYSVALQIARLPYVGVIAISLVLFPLVSKETYQGDTAKTRSIIQNATRYTLLLASFFALGASSCSSEILKLVFTPIFANGSVELSLLALGYLAFSMMMIFTTIASGAGRPQMAALIVALTLILSAVANGLAVPLAGTKGAATATALVMMTGAVGAWFWVRAHFAIAFPWSTILRTIVAAIVAFGVSWFWSADTLVTIILKGAVVALLLAVILASDLKREELNKIKTIISRG